MYLSQHDLLTGAIALAIITLSLTGIEIAVKKELITKLIGRKLLHITAICSCAYTIGSFENSKMLAGIFLVFFFLLLAVINKGWMQVNEYKTYGIALFPLAFSIVLTIPVFSKNIIAFAALTLAICDAIAGITGEYFGRQKISFLFEQKSWIGFMAFYSTCFLLSVLYFNQQSLNGLLLCSILALAPALTELFSYKGSDNLSVPLVTAIWTYFILQLTSYELQAFSIYIILFLLLSFVAVYKKWLTISGATAALWMALMLFITGGLQAFIAPGIFLLCGSLLSKLNKNEKEKNGRNAVQVFCNGIVGIICFTVYAITHRHVFLLAALVSFCISMSDSASSEIGTYIKGVTIDIISLKRLPAGISGGISLQGTLAGFTGAFLLTASVYYVYHFTAVIFCWITLSGIAGMLADSILGSMVQKKYTTSYGQIVEEEETGAVKIKGFRWCGNNMVNILSNLIITLLFILFYQ